jgi:hypothetical protein
MVFLRSYLESPNAGSDPTKLEPEPHLASPSAISLLLTQHVQRPNTASHHAGQKFRSAPFGTDEPKSMS